MTTITRTHSNHIMHDICVLYEHINYARYNGSNDTLITHLITIAFLVIRKIALRIVVKQRSVSGSRGNVA